MPVLRKVKIVFKSKERMQRSEKEREIYAKLRCTYETHFCVNHIFRTTGSLYFTLVECEQKTRNIIIHLSRKNFAFIYVVTQRPKRDEKRITRKG